MCNMSAACVQLASAGKPRRFTSFNDQALSDGRIIIDLVDACRPGAIKYDLVKDAFTDEVLAVTLCSVTFLTRISFFCSPDWYRNKILFLQSYCYYME